MLTLDDASLRRTFQELQDSGFFSDVDLNQLFNTINPDVSLRTLWTPFLSQLAQTHGRLATPNPSLDYQSDLDQCT